MFEFARFNIAVRRNANEADFFVCEAYNKLASNISTYCQKGSQIALTGELRNDSYVDKDNNKRTITKIEVRNVEFLSKSENRNQEVQPQQNVYPQQPAYQTQYQPQQNQYNPTYTQPVSNPQTPYVPNQQPTTPSLEDLNSTFNVPYGKLPF